MIIHRERALLVPSYAGAAVESMVTGELQDLGQVVLEGPDHAVTLALRLDEGFRHDLVVMGPRTRAVYHAAEPRRSWLKVRLKPEAVRGLLGGAAADLVDQAVPLAAVTGDRAVRRLVADGPATLLAGLSAKVGTDDRAGLIRRATALLATGLEVAETARRLHLSERQFRTVFGVALGISPKQFARISRVRSVIDRAGRRPLAQVAIEAGYYDQSHLTAEFKALMGVPPAAFANGKMPQATACQSSA